MALHAGHSATRFQLAIDYLFVCLGEQIKAQIMINNSKVKELQVFFSGLNKDVNGLGTIRRSRKGGCVTEGSLGGNQKKWFSCGTRFGGLSDQGERARSSQENVQR